MRRCFLWSGCINFPARSCARHPSWRWQRRTRFSPCFSQAFFHLLTVGCCTSVCRHASATLRASSNPRHEFLGHERAALLADAGNDPQNFLRNLPQFPSGWFQQNPLEFIASIANQWVAESQICLQLGREKLGFGRRQPMEQALFFADMLSTGNTVPFFRCGTSGVIQSRTATLGRDAQGRIISITDGGVRLDIVYDAQGHVASATQTAQDCDGEEPFQQAARSSKFDSFRSMSVRYIQLRAELLPYGKKLADGVATPEERRVHNRIEEAMGAEFRRLNRYMWDNRWTDEDRAAMGWILYGAQQPK